MMTMILKENNYSLIPNVYVLSSSDDHDDNDDGERVVLVVEIICFTIFYMRLEKPVEIYVIKRFIQAEPVLLDQNQPSDEMTK